MSEVSPQSFFTVLGLAQRAEVDVSDLFDLDDLDAIERSNGVEWASFAAMCDRVVAAKGDELDSFVDPPDSDETNLYGALRLIGGALESSLDVYLATARWYGPFLHRNVRFDCRKMNEREVRFSVSILPHDVGSIGWITLVAIGLGRIPVAVGHPEADVEVLHLSEREGRFLVRIQDEQKRTEEAPEEVPDLLRFLLAVVDREQGFENQFLSYLDSIPALVALHRDGEVIHANSALQACVPEILGRDLSDYFLTEGAEALLGPKVRPDGMTIQFRSSAGDLHLRAFGISNVQFMGRSVSVFTGFDITPGVRAQAGLVEMTHTISALTETLPDLVIRIGADGRVLDFLAGNGFPAVDLLRQFIGQDVREFAQIFIRGQEPDRSEHIAELARAVRHREPLDIETWVYVADSRRKAPVDIRVFPLEEESILILRDITDKHELQRQLALSERLASLGSIAAGVGHEINNPLTWVEGSLVALQAELGSADLDLDSVRGLVEEALDGTHRIRRITDDLKAFTRVDRAERKRVDVAGAVESALRLTESETRQRARVSVEVEPRLSIVGQESKLVQIIVNLVTNAAQAFPHLSDSAAIEITAESKGESVRIEVRDNGPGMTDDIRARIFDPFFTTKPKTGTGLGLPIVRRLVAEMSGELSVESEVGRGTTVAVEFSIDRSAPSPPKRSAPEPVDESHKLQIALIDDEPQVLRALARLLRPHEVTTFTSGTDLFEDQDVDQFDVIICDVMMPHTPGPLLWPKFQDANVGDRVIWMTGGAFTDEAISFLESAKCPILEKPIRPNEFAEAIAQVTKSTE